MRFRPLVFHSLSYQHYSSIPVLPPRKYAMANRRVPLCTAVQYQTARPSSRMVPRCDCRVGGLSR